MSRYSISISPILLFLVLIMLLELPHAFDCVFVLKETLQAQIKDFYLEPPMSFPCHLQQGDKYCRFSLLFPENEHKMVKVSA